MTLIALFLLILFAFSLIFKRAARSIITGPMVFTILGLVVYFVLPITTPEITNPAVLLLAEITLAVILFSDATRLEVRKVIRERDLPARLLGIGMPLTVLFGALAAVLTVSNGDLWQAAILATILAPTDPSVASSIVKSPLVPHRLREALEIEAGFNDGISLPLLVLFVALSGVEVGLGGQFPWLTYTLQLIGFGVIAGLVIGWLAGWLMTQAEQRGWMVSEARQLVMLSVAILSWWAGGNLLPGNGFIAAFVAGCAIRYVYGDAQLQMEKFNNEWGTLLVYLVFYAFGMIAAPVLGLIPVVIWMYAILSLAVVRMLAVGTAMIGANLKPSSVAYLGWFGPRGLASIILGIIYLNRATQIFANSNILMAMVATVILSIFAHGISANPLIRLYARRGGERSAGPTTTPAD